MNILNQDQIQSQHIMSLMGQIEDKTGECFGDLYPDLETRCIEAIDGLANKSYVVNILSKILEEVNR